MIHDTPPVPLVPPIIGTPPSILLPPSPVSPLSPVVPPSVISPSQVTPSVPETPVTPDTTPTIMTPVSLLAKTILPVVESITAITVKAINTPAGLLIVQTVSTIGVVLGIAALAMALFASPLTLPEIVLIPARVLSLIMFSFGIKKRNRPWGTVYDSVTKQPIDPAFVTLKNLQGKEVATAITDLDGRYGFLVVPGIYTLHVRKTNYSFPSQKLAGKTSDPLYDNLYFGEALEIKNQGDVIAKNIPLDAEGFNWNEFVKKSQHLTVFYSRWDVAIRRASNIFFVVGFIVAIIAFFAAPYPYNTLILGGYLFLWLLRVLGIKPKPFGHIINKTTGMPSPFAIIRIMVPGSNVQVAHKVADQYGKYYCLVPKGKYYITIEEKKPDGSYLLTYTSPTIDTLNSGIIKKTFRV